MTQYKKTAFQSDPPLSVLFLNKKKIIFRKKNFFLQLMAKGKPTKVMAKKKRQRVFFIIMY